jgi:AraC family transcriptional regulator, regulatory protein of adaptative response / methylated-DNA-[protein]-cysteine methyltransferase
MKNNHTAVAGESQENTSLLSKTKVLERLSHTKLNTENAAFDLAKWVPEDKKLEVRWDVYPTTLGEVLIASTDKGVCFLGFGDEQKDFTLTELQEKFPENKLEKGSSPFHQEALSHIGHPEANNTVHLHLKGTVFQLNIWEKILKVPFGGLTTYAKLGDQPRNARAVGTAVGANPVCLIVGCHRVVHSDGNIEGFHYGTPIKEKLLAFEAANSRITAG